MRGLPLRIKLIALSLALLVVGLLFIGLVSVSVLHGYLIDRVDSQISLVTTRMRDKMDTMTRREESGKLPLNKPILVESDTIVLVKEQSGELRSMLGGRDIDLRPGPVVPEVVGTYTVGSVSGEAYWRTRVTTIPSGTYVVAVDLTEVGQITRQLALIELMAGGGILLLLAVVGVTTVRRSMRPLAEIERTAEAIAAGELGRRVPAGDRRTEVGRLAQALNGMLAQIETAFAARSASEGAARKSEERMRRFVADASHELRTPLTSIRGFAEYARQNPGADQRRLLLQVEQSAERMGLLVDDLLLLARVDQQRPLRRHPVDVLALAADAVHEARILTPERAVSLVVAGGGALIVLGDELRLRQVVGNLMSNAQAHTPADSPITVRVGVRDLTVFLEVADKGPGLTAEQAERVFERFYRADSARSRRSGEDRGNGLGLAIVEALITAHDGTVVLDTKPGEGATFRIELPLAPE